LQCLVGYGEWWAEDDGKAMQKTPKDKIKIKGNVKIIKYRIFITRYRNPTS
jgi:hypothetical protein